MTNTFAKKIKYGILESSKSEVELVL